MNRLLVLPGLTCLAGFFLLYGAMHESAARNVVDSTPVSPNLGLHEESLVATNGCDVQDIGRLLDEKFIEPWREAQSASHRIMSRVAPRPILIPEIDLASSVSASQGYYLGKVTMGRGKNQQCFPFVIDQLHGIVLVFSDHQWQLHEAWFKRHAPLGVRLRPLEDD